MDRDNLIKECDRLLNFLGTLDPTTEKYKTIKERLLGSSGKGGSKGLYDALLEMDTNAQDLLDKERKIEIEFKKLEVERLKVDLEQKKFESQEAIEQAKLANDTRRLDNEEERIQNEKSEAERRLDIDELKAQNEAEELQQRRRYTKAQCGWRIAEIAAITLGQAALIGYTGKIQETGVLDKNLFGLIPTTKKY